MVCGGDGGQGSRCHRSSPTGCPHTHETQQGKCVPRPRPPLSSIRSTWAHGLPAPGGTLALQDVTPRLARTTGPIRCSFVLLARTLRVPPLPCLKLSLLPSLTVSSKRHRQRVRVCFNNETATLATCYTVIYHQLKMIIHELGNTS